MTADSHRTMSRPIAIALTPPIVGAPVKMSRASTACALLFACSQAFGGIAASGVESAKEEFNPERFEVAIESGYLFGFINPPRSYQIGAEFLTARVRWGVVRSDVWLRGYNYFGLNFGMRYNFVRPRSRLVPYISGGLGLGWIDSHPEIHGGQGQDFTFNILTAAGISYKMNDHWKLNAGILYQHLSNGGQTDPNPSLNLLGPQVGATYSF